MRFRSRRIVGRGLIRPAVFSGRSIGRWRSSVDDVWLRRRFGDKCRYIGK